MPSSMKFYEIHIARTGKPVLTIKGILGYTMVMELMTEIARKSLDTVESIEIKECKP